MKKLFTLALALMGFATANAATVDDVAVLKHSYVLVCDDWNNSGTEKIASGTLYGDGFFFTPTGNDCSVKKGTVNLSVVNEADDNHVTAAIADKYGEEYNKDHFNSLRLKNNQDIIVMKVTAKSKIIFFLQGNNKTGTEARIPKLWKGGEGGVQKKDDCKDDNALNPKPTADHPTTDAGFRFEYVAEDDMTLWVGSWNGDMFLSYIIVEANEAPGTPSVKVGEQTYENGLWFREVTCKAVPATEEGSDEKIPTVVTYTTNGMAPTASSEVYTGPIKCYEDMTVKFQAFLDFGSGKPEDDFIIDGADNEAIVSFQFDAPSIEADGNKVTITSPYEGAKNYVTLDGDVENAEEKSELTLSESATVTAFSKIVNGEYTTFVSKSAKKDVYVLEPIKEKKIVTVTDGEVVVDEEATAQDPNGETIYMVKNGVISADKKDFFVKDLAYGVIKDAAYQIDSKEMYIKMSTTNITFQVAEGDSVTVKVICSKNSCKNLEAADAEDGSQVNDRKCYVNVSGTNYCLKDAEGNETNDLKLYPEANEFEFGLPAGTWTFQKYSGTGNILISSIEIAPATEGAADAPELQAPDGWTKAITNGNLAGTDVSSFFAKEAPSADIVGATIVEGAGKDGSRGIVVKSADDPTQAWDTQFWIKLDEALPEGTKLHVQFDYKADKAAKASTQAHGAPGAYQHWAAIGDVNFTTEWQNFSTDIEVSSDMATGSGGNGLLSIAFNLAEEKTATEYCFDNFGVWYQKPKPVDEWADLIVNGDMEGADMQCFYVTEQGVGGPFVAVPTPGKGKDGGKAIALNSADNPAQDWDTQFFIRLPYQLPAGTKYRISFDYKADKAGDFDTQSHAEPGGYIHWAMIGSGSFTTEWKTYEHSGSISSDQSPSGNMQTIAFNLAKNKAATEFIFDNVKFEIEKSVADALTPNPAENPATYPLFPEGPVYLQDVASGKFLAAGHNWGTRAIVNADGLDFTPTLADGKYTLDSKVSNGGDSHFLGNNLYTDAAAFGWTVDRAGKGVITISNGTQFVGVDADDNVVWSDEAVQWKPVTRADRVKALKDATAEAPANATFLVTDANFNRNDQRKSAWTGDDFGVGGDGGEANADKFNAEKWGGNSQTFDISQTVTDVPNGLYSITWNGFYRYNNTEENTNDVAIAAHADGTEVINSFVYLNDTDYPLTSIADETASAALEGALPFSQAAAGVAFAQGLYEQTAMVIITDGKLTIGIKKIDHPGTDWTVWDNFRLSYLGEITEDPELEAPEGWTKAVSNGNLAGEEVANYVSKEAPSTEPVGATIMAGAGKGYSRGIIVKSADNPSQAWDTQFWIKVDEALPAGTKLHVQFDYKANKAAKASTQAHGEPGAYQHWACIGDVNFTTDWQTFSTEIEVSSDMATGSGGNGLLSIAFNLSEEKTATEYYFDNFGVWYQKPAPVDDWTDLIVNGDMEGDDMQCFYATEQGVGGPFVATPTPGIGKDGGSAIKVQTGDSPANDWASQFFIRLPYQLPAGTKFRLTFDHKASVEGSSDTQCHAEPGQYIHYACAGSPTSTTEWQTYTYEGTIPSQCDGSAGDGFDKIFQTIAFNLAKNGVATEFIFDNVKFEVPADVAKDLTPNPSGISNVYREVPVNGVRYNLEGIRVNENYKGIIIMNGKKMIQK